MEFGFGDLWQFIGPGIWLLIPIAFMFLFVVGVVILGWVLLVDLGRSAKSERVSAKETTEERMERACAQVYGSFPAGSDAKKVVF